MNRLRDLREAAGLTQKELAEKASVSRVTVSRWENSKFSPTSDSAVKIAEALGVDIGSLVDNDAEAALSPKGYVSSERDISAWRDVVIRDQGLSQWEQVILMSMPIFMDRSHWFVPVTMEQFIATTGRSRDIVEGSWMGAIESDYVEAIGEVRWALRLVFP